MGSSELNLRFQKLKEFLAQDPNNKALLADTFELARQLCDWQQASKYADHGIHLWSDPLWKLRAGEVALAQLLWTDAERWFEEVRQDPSSGEDLRCAAEHQLAEVMLHTGQFDSGITLISAYFEGEAAVPAASASQILWLRLLHRVGRLPDALDYAQRLEIEATLSPQVASVASLVALDANRLDLAVRWADMALQLKSGNRPFEALITRASIALGQPDAGMAQALLSEALQMKPRDGRTWAMMAFTVLLQQQFDKAIEHFNTALNYMPDHVGTWHGLGWALIQQRDLVRAKDVFQHALSLDRNFAESHGGLAVVLALIGDKEGAAASIEIAHKLDRNSAAVRYAAAVLSGDYLDPMKISRLAARTISNTKKTTE